MYGRLTLFRGLRSIAGVYARVWKRNGPLSLRRTLASLLESSTMALSPPLLSYGLRLVMLTAGLSVMAGVDFVEEKEP